MALNRHRLHHLVRKGNKSAKLTAKLLAQTDKLLGSMLLGNTLLNVVAAALTQIIILRMFGHSEWALVSGTLIITFVILVFSEIMPKVIAASHPERIALPSSYVLAPLNKLFYPVVYVAMGMVHGFLWLFRIKIHADQSKQKLNLDELRTLVLESEQFLPRKHQKMLLNLVDIERTAVNDVMVPRNQIEALDLNTTPEILREQLATCHHTLLPVYDGALDILWAFCMCGVRCIWYSAPVLMPSNYVSYWMNLISSHLILRCYRSCSIFRSGTRGWAWWWTNMVSCWAWSPWKIFLRKLSAILLLSHRLKPVNFCAMRMVVCWWKVARPCVI